MYLDYCEFYITNVCNLTCSNCNRFNNYNVKGRVDFNYDLYKPWADKLNFGYIGIIGGEPLLHPNLKDWIIGIHSLWPNTAIQITINGTRINYVRDLFNTFVECNVIIEITLHDTIIDKFVFEELEKFKEKGTNWQKKVIDNTQLDRDNKEMTITNEYLTCDQGLMIKFNPGYYFQSVQITEKQHQSNRVKPIIGDPERAHYVCGIKNSHTFYEGKLYKCGFIPSIKEYFKTYNHNDGWDPVYKYEAHEFDSDLTRLTKPENVCSLCPNRIKTSKVITSFK